jgi:hypothetical protein
MASVIVPVGALIIAVLSVVALWLWWTGDSPNELAVEQANIVSQTDSMPSNIAEISSAPVQALPSQATGEIMRVVRSSDSQIQVVINGTTYQSIADVERDSLAHDQLMSTLGALSQFAQLEKSVSIMPTPVSQPSAPPQNNPAVTVTAGIPSEIEEADPTSVAAQIERFLQDRLLKTPGMMSRSIHIYSTPTGGVQIKVGSTLYESVSDVDETEAREIIEAAIRDWEASI